MFKRRDPDRSTDGQEEHSNLQRKHKSTDYNHHLPVNHRTFLSNHSTHCSFIHAEEMAVSTTPLKTTVGLT